MEQRKIDRINALARKAKAGPLTAEEEAERAQLRRENTREYIDAVVGSLKGQLDHTYIVDASGRKTKLRRKGEK